MDVLIKELNDFYKDCQPQKKYKLIDGKFGKVSVYKHTLTQKEFLVKEIAAKNYNGIETFIHDLMKDNKYFIKVYYACTSLRSHVLIMDFIKGGDLFDLLRCESRLTEKETQLIVCQLCDALDALHRRKFIHNDIKLENILYTRYHQIYLCDFGLCKCIGTESNFDGTLDYFSPEKIKKKPNDVHNDWWAVGILMYEMMTGKHPYKQNIDEDLTVDVLERRQRLNVSFKTNLSVTAKSFISSLLRYNINYRLNAYDNICKHLFYTQSNDLFEM